MPETVLERKDFKILRDFSVQTDQVIEGRRPDCTVGDKKNRTCKITDFAASRDRRIEEKEQEKVGKCQDLAGELQKIWNVRVYFIPLVACSLRASLGKNKKNITKKGKCQSTILLSYG